MSVDYPLVSDCLAPEGGGTERVTAVDEVLGHFTREQLPWDYDPAEMARLHLAAFNERLVGRRETVRALGQRVDQLGIDKAETLDDVAALMFSSNVYKSYPDSFIAKGRWSHLLTWLDSLSSHSIAHIDVSGCADIDDFMERVRAGGYRVMNTSGTSGKPSLFPQSLLDLDRVGEIAAREVGWMCGLDPARPRAIFYTGNRSGNYGGHAVFAGLTSAFGRADAIFALFEEPLRTAEVGRLAALNRALVNGTATPNDIADAQERKDAAETRASAALDRFCDKLAEHAGEPILLYAQVYVFYRAMQRLKETGRHPDFHPGGRIFAGGGTKNNKLPEGFMDEIKAFYGLPVAMNYGQSEIHAKCPQCVHGRYHLSPNMMLLLLDPAGERVLNENPGDGTFEGVAAIFDFAIDGRWGGVVSGDWLTVSYAPCPCGLRSPQILSVQRVAEVTAAARDDDKVNCGGRVEMYIRGVVS